MNYIVEKNVLTIWQNGIPYKKTFKSSSSLKRAISQIKNGTFNISVNENIEVIGEDVFINDIKLPDCLNYIRDFSENEMKSFVKFWKSYHITKESVVESEDFISTMRKYRDDVIKAYSKFDKEVLLKSLESLQKNPSNSKLLQYYTKFPREIDFDKFLLPQINIKQFVLSEITNINLQSYGDEITLNSCELPEHLKEFTKDLKIKSIFCFDNHLETNLEKRILLHGTKNISVLSIIQKGLKIKPEDKHVKSGSAYGNGLYFSEITSKSLNYCSNNDKVIMFFEVAVGNPYVYKGRYKTNSFPLNNYELKKRNYDSVYVPQGDGMLNSEIIVYNENQVALKYLIWIV